ncbi:hypothetical protein [Pseudomonas fluorescens]|uniref:Uncharacterized protein n=1 Tax=Pseudomonas fluorescens TaxID=294 RepID=A0A5E6RGD1_PSEFL|nr:hypothetical protein [Pseudomonas fluorescens]VVM67171.1 hypothetical protein PS652_01586 [Pseudomonas fluorescens]
MRAKVVATIFALIGASGAMANGGLQPRNWVLEPENFLGIQLNGEPLHDLPECGAESLGLCFERTSKPNQYKILGGQHPCLKGNYAVEATFVGSKLEKLNVLGSAEGLNQLSDLLVAKYGEPSSRELIRLETKTGYSFVSEVMNWSGNAFSMTLRRTDNDTSAYSLTLTNLKLSPPALSKAAPEAVGEAAEL